MHRRSALALALLALLAVAAPAAAKQPKPQFGKTAVLSPVKGTVFYKERGGKRHRLRHRHRVRMPVQVSATDGTTTVKTALPNGKTQAARFNGAPFMLSQPRGGNGLTDLKLNADLQCGPGAAHAARRSRLFGSGHGRFRTRGRNSSATVRGTTWVTQDDCTGTQITSVRGEVQTDAEGANLSRLLDPGQTVTYYCNVEGTTQPEPGTYCTLVLSDPAKGIVGMGIIDITDETQYNLCLIYPSGIEDCGDLPLSDPFTYGFRQSVVACFVPEPGAYRVRWTVGGQVLFPELSTPPITPIPDGPYGCAQSTDTSGEGASRTAAPGGGAPGTASRAPVPRALARALR